MKFIISLIVLISVAYCGKSPLAIVAPEEAFRDVKQSILECISKDENASSELKQYATEQLNAGFKETLIFSRYQQNETDRNIIRLCRRKAFLITSKRAWTPPPLANISRPYKMKN